MKFINVIYLATERIISGPENLLSVTTQVKCRESFKLSIRIAGWLLSVRGTRMQRLK